ncbi:transaldolase [Synechococcus phage S-SKS1]|uniref:Transaldolase n=1 Tax=Synechococcus phage S-SKS1 TaxID=754042 RepID=M4QRR4_9CAUD|nr:transaldolase [Synechococcus phage S-SKS1]AGH31538.1 transaldolase [Synechococcus phage S-SKS1]
MNCKLMKLFLDTADVDAISEANTTGMIEGITTNPTLIKASGMDPVEVIKEISSMSNQFESVSAEVVADTAEEMIDQAMEFEGLWNVTIKVPCTVEGLKACTALASVGRKVNVTLIFSAAQAILARRAGAAYISPFVGRMNDNSLSGVALVQTIASLYNQHFSTTKIIAASVRDVHQVGRCFDAGAEICTIPPHVFWGMYNHVLTDQGLEKFQKDWNSVKGL